jgi:hypothetical protein
LYLTVLVELKDFVVAVDVAGDDFVDCDLLYITVLHYPNCSVNLLCKEKAAGNGWY